MMQIGVANLPTKLDSWVICSISLVDHALTTIVHLGPLIWVTCVMPHPQQCHDLDALDIGTCDVHIICVHG